MALMRKLLGLGSIAVMLGACQPVPEASAPTLEDDSPEALVELGRSLVETSGCHDCHTPKIFEGGIPVLDEARWLAGHPEEAGVPESLPFEPSLEPGGWGVAATNHLTGWGGAWGMSFGVNLTPDQETGIGSWTEEMFIQALRTGKHQGTGRDVLPPMPWMLYGKKSDRELRAMFAYLMSLPPVRNAVPEPVATEDLQP
jgi:mono/diheme cytochrome c family protein